MLFSFLSFNKLGAATGGRNLSFGRFEFILRFICSIFWSQAIEATLYSRQKWSRYKPNQLPILLTVDYTHCSDYMYIIERGKPHLPSLYFVTC